MNVAKQARKDATEFAAAQMAHGQGAGTRRKLIKATVDHRANTIPGYLSAFYDAALAQDMSRHVAEAKRARRVKDVSTAVSKNAKGIATRNWKSVNGGILILLGAGYVAHQTGYDKIAWEKAKKKYADFKNRAKNKAQVLRILDETK